jgi:hypothetical protein
MTVETECELDRVIGTVEKVVAGNTTGNGDNGWWRMGNEGLDVIVMQKEGES